MKTIVSLLFFSGYIVLSFNFLYGQSGEDPLVNTYKIGGSSEVYISFSNSDNSHNYQGIMDVPSDLSNFTAKENAYPSEYLDPRMNASVTGDFNGDGIDEIISIRKYPDNSKIELAIPIITIDLLCNSLKTYTDPNLESGSYQKLRICAGHFRGDLRKKEFAVAYGNVGGDVKVSLFETDSLLNIKFLGTIGTTYFDNNFDITSGDIDGDGTDEIILVKNIKKPEQPNDFDVNSFYNLYILKYNGQLVFQEQKENIQIRNIEGDRVTKNSYRDNNSFISEMRIACGDLNAEGKDEIIVGWSFFHVYIKDYIEVPAGYHYHRRNDYYLHAFSKNEEGAIEKVDSIYVSFFNYGLNSAPANKHITLSLECNKLGDLDRDQIIMSANSDVFIYGLKEGKKIKKMGNLALSNYLNVQGNENFVLGDLNPDTSKLDFKKEIIVLKSNSGIVQQKDNKASVSQLQIFSIDTLDYDSVKFMPPGAPIDIPFAEGNSKEITISAFVAGDLDLKEAEIYNVSSPEIIHVTGVQEPIFIINCPPAHYDLINDTIFDLNNVFKKDTSFYTTIKTTTNESNTTSVTSKLTKGYSLNFNAHAFYGGTGFEHSVDNNYTNEKSYFNANTINTKCEQGQTFKMASKVLCSEKDLVFYRYKVTNNKNQFVGHIAVVSPVSDPHFVWIEGNDWNSPLYSLDHEPGNIFSYFPFKNVNDIYTGSEPQIYHEFNETSVTKDGSGYFVFKYDDFSANKSSISMASSVTKNTFAQLGYERTVTSGINAKVFSMSRSVDIRIGVSAELCKSFSASSLSTQETTLNNAFSMEGHIGSLDKKYDLSAVYTVIPYIYRAKCGALVLDYIVNIKNNMGWWKDRYSKPDLAFILPNRLASEQGVEGVRLSQKQKTNDIQFFPPIASPGDTVRIVARVHNFSLSTYNKSYKVVFYQSKNTSETKTELVPILNLDGDSSVTVTRELNTFMDYNENQANDHFEEYVSFDWIVPETGCSPSIYARIVPDTTVTEVHTNNNVGWNRLYLYNCDDCEYNELTTDIENHTNSVFVSIEAFPNPFDLYTTLRFSLERTERVQINLYDDMGKKLSTLTDMFYPGGEHQMQFNANGLTGGIYLCKVSAGSFTKTIKLIVIR